MEREFEEKIERFVADNFNDLIDDNTYRFIKGLYKYVSLVYHNTYKLSSSEDSDSVFSDLEPEEINYEIDDEGFMYLT